MKAYPTPSQSLLQERLRYDPVSGLLIFKRRSLVGFKNLRSQCSWNGKFAGELALNKINTDGYRAGSLDNQPLLQHRVIWKLVYGYDPEKIDHESGIRHDNRLVNLRDACDVTNSQNTHLRSDNSSGYPGIYKIKDRDSWTVEITFRRVTHYLGSYSSKDEAISVRKAAEIMYMFHPNHGRTDDYSSYR